MSKEALVAFLCAERGRLLEEQRQRRVAELLASRSPSRPRRRTAAP
jgi:hypothetical protein